MRYIAVFIFVISVLISSSKNVYFEKENSRFKRVENNKLHCFSVSGLGASVHLNFIFHFDVVAATSVFDNLSILK